MANRVGQEIGNYRLIHLLGSGGFADVYLGQHIHLTKRQVAIKILHDTLIGKHEAQFLHEAQIIANLEHPCIVRVIDFGIEKTPYLVMEYVSQGTLRNIYRRGSLVPLHIIVPSIKQIASALQYAHDQRIIHQDIKPENFLVRDTNDVILSDFGISVIAQNTTSMKTSDYAGTIQYSAPEHLKGKPRIASDQYSLGIVAYEWLCGNVPFSGSQAEIITQHLTETPQPLSHRIPIAPAIEAVVLRALSKEPSERFGSVRAFAEALEWAYQAISVSPVPHDGQPSRNTIILSQTPLQTPTQLAHVPAPEVRPAPPPSTLSPVPPD